MIKRIKIHNLNALKDPTYRFPGNYGVEKFLELFSGEFANSVQTPRGRGGGEGGKEGRKDDEDEGTGAVCLFASCSVD